ncbi:MAG: FadR/GntR family transcriptional regulator [Micromonosporaceae bacterium]
MAQQQGTDSRQASLHEALFSPVHVANAFEETVERLLRAIKLGVVKPGERLPPERELAARLAVSRVTLREAMSELRRAGYVESRRGRYGGTVVTSPTARPGRERFRRAAAELESGMEDLLCVRHVVEVGAAEQAARRRPSSEEAARLRALLAESKSATSDDYRRLDSRLHLAIAEATGSATLTTMAAGVRMRLNALLDAIPLLQLNIEHANEQHEAIVDAILGGDPAAARQAMAEHLAGTAALLRGFLA